MKRFIFTFLLLLACVPAFAQMGSGTGSFGTVGPGGGGVPTVIMYATPANFMAQGVTASNTATSNAWNMVEFTAGNYNITNTFWLSPYTTYKCDRGVFFGSTNGSAITAGWFSSYTNWNVYWDGFAVIVCTNGSSVFELAGNGNNDSFFVNFQDAYITNKPGHLFDTGQTNIYFSVFNSLTTDANQTAPLNCHNHCTFCLTGNAITNNAAGLFNGVAVNCALNFSSVYGVFYNPGGIQVQSGGTFTTGIGTYVGNLSNDSGLIYLSQGTQLADLTFVSDNASQNTLSGWGTYTNGVGFNFNFGQANATLTVGSTGVTNNTTDTYLVSVTAGVGMALKDQTGTSVFSPIANDTFPLKPGWRLSATSGVTGVAVILNR